MKSRTEYPSGQSTLTVCTEFFQFVYFSGQIQLGLCDDFEGVRKLSGVLPVCNTKQNQGRGNVKISFHIHEQEIVD